MLTLAATWSYAQLLVATNNFGTDVGQYSDGSGTIRVHASSVTTPLKVCTRTSTAQDPCYGINDDWVTGELLTFSGIAVVGLILLAPLWRPGRQGSLESGSAPDPPLGVVGHRPWPSRIGGGHGSAPAGRFMRGARVVSVDSSRCRGAGR